MDTRQAGGRSLQAALEIGKRLRVLMSIREDFRREVTGLGIGRARGQRLLQLRNCCVEFHVLEIHPRQSHVRGHGIRLDLEYLPVFLLSLPGVVLIFIGLGQQQVNFVGLRFNDARPHQGADGQSLG